jgi:hypothetical protein
MKFPAKASADFAICPAGNHVAICNAVVDLGMQPGSGQYPDPKHQVYIRFELPTEQIKYTKEGVEISGPMSIGRTFTASMSEKANLRKFVESWFGKKFPNDGAAAEFDHAVLLGRKCLLNVTHTEKEGGKTYANISAATPIPKGMTADYPQHNPSLYFDLSNPDAEAFNRLPEWLQNKITERIEAVPPKSAESEYLNGAGGGPENDIPFAPVGGLV